jgi:transposase-like protein
MEYSISNGEPFMVRTILDNIQRDDCPLCNAKLRDPFYRKAISGRGWKDRAYWTCPVCSNTYHVRNNDNADLAAKATVEVPRMIVPRSF